ncbi:DnaA ATPase domain-containing protein [Candidatus Uabimicrobium sp. HlEnr_7]|uniref:DnaA/Hda family protein n=1 Tax=Candidatus Uabimicrobium helgolandensis TaxID=3095367 RepID=UPI0035592866
MPKKHKFQLRRFITDSNNKLAFEIANKLVKTSKADYTPLHIFGPKHTGKSHILGAINNEIVKKEKNVIRCFARSFYLDYVFSLKNRSYQEFRQRYRSADVLIIEDIDFLKKKNNTQRELVFLIDELISRSKIIITSSQIHPKQLKDFNSALATRLSSGLFIPIKPVKTQTIQDYFLRMAKNLQVEFEEGALEVIDKQCIVTQLREKIEKLIVFCSETKKNISKEIISKCIEHSAKKELTCEMILQTVSEHYEIEDSSTLLEKQSSRICKEPRYIAIKIVKELLKLSNENVAEYFHCSESSVRHACKKSDNEFAEVCKVLKNVLVK